MQPEVEEFVAAAREFTGLIDNLATADRDDFLKSCLIVLPRLLSLGISLPEQEAEDDPSVEFSVQPGAAVGVHPWLDQFYWLVYDPIEGGEPVGSTIGQDLSEIYQDIKKGLLAYDSQDSLARAEALWEWQFFFNWGWHTAQHIVHVLPAIHSARFIH